MNLIEEFARRLTKSETAACHCDDCKRMRKELRDMLDKIERLALESINVADSYWRMCIKTRLRAAFTKMRGE